MLRRRQLVTTALLGIAACTAGAPPAPAPVGETGASAPAAANWKSSMEATGKHWKVLEKALDKNPVGNLRAAAEAATAAADLMRHGYGKFEDKRVPGFAKYARDAESWLLRLALEARQDRPDMELRAVRGQHAPALRCGLDRGRGTGEHRDDAVVPAADTALRRTSGAVRAP